MCEADEHIILAGELEYMHLGEKGFPYSVDNSILGLDEGAEVRMPNKEFERGSGNEESAIMLLKVSLGIVDEQGAFGETYVGRGSQFTDSSSSSEY